MGRLAGRLARLEAERRRGDAEISREALRHLSDEDLDALEDALGVGRVVWELEARVAEVEVQQRPARKNPDGVAASCWRAIVLLSACRP